MTNKFEVLLPLPFDNPFSYFADEELEIGDVALVPFGKNEIYGVVLGKNYSDDLDPKKIKKVIAKDQALKINPKLLELIKWAANYNLAPQGSILKLAISILNSTKPAKRKDKERKIKIEKEEFDLKPLMPLQKEAADFLIKSVSSKCNSTILLDGITGSGKTEVYFRAIKKILEEDRGQILILLPEIALTSQLISRFEKQFKFSPTLWHSKISPGKKRKIFYSLAKGEQRVVIGARSALFLPFYKLSLIIVDEEHDSSFKQEDVVNYNGRDMAIVRGKIEQIPVLLSSATPSLETYINAKSGKYHHLKLTERFSKQEQTQIDMVDMRSEKLEPNHHISKVLLEELKINIENHKQSLLFINRRGYAPLTICKSCGHKVNCPNCSAYVTYHQKYNRLVCHHCGHSQRQNNKCTSCKTEGGLICWGIGAEKIQEEIKELFPEARISLMTSDEITNPDEAETAINQIINHEIDIIIGTQMIAKGHHFPALSLVGIVDGDASFYSSDLRVGERSYQLLTQVIGRAGREKYQGKVLIQSHNPDNLIFKNIINNNRDEFLDLEVKNRQEMDMPPFSKMSAIIFHSLNEQLCIQAAKSILRLFPSQPNLEIFGPAPMPISRIRNRFYYRLIIKSKKKLNIQKLIRQILDKSKIPSQVRVKVDIDLI